MGRQRLGSITACSELEQSSRVPGLSVARGLLRPLLRRRLEATVDASLLNPSTQGSACASGSAAAPNQAMRFGADLPCWVRRLSKRCARLDGLLTPEVASRQPLFDQLIVNSYGTGQGIHRHVDLLKFDDGILGICLGADATLTLRRLRDGVEVVPGCECAIADSDLTGDVVDVDVHAGDVYSLCGEARFRWTHEIAAASLRGGRR